MVRCIKRAMYPGYVQFSSFKATLCVYIIATESSCYLGATVYRIKANEKEKGRIPPTSSVPITLKRCHFETFGYRTC